MRCYIFCFSPQPLKPGDYRFPRLLSVSLSVRMSVSPLSVRQLGLPNLFSVVIWDIDLKFGIWICLAIIYYQFRLMSLTFDLLFYWIIALFKNFVFRTFLNCPLRYWLEIWYLNLSRNNTDQVRILSRLTYFDLSYSLLAKSPFSGLFSPVICDIHLKFSIWICLDILRIKFDFVMFDIILHELLPFAKILFSGLFFAIFWDTYL